jgi:hypothetical protein
MVRIRRFGLLKTATVAAAMYFVVIIVFGLLLAPFFAIATVSMPANVRPPGFDPGTGLVGLILFVLLAAVAYAIVGWIFTAIACLLYNIVAGFVGGVEVQLEDVSPPPAPNWGPPQAPPPGQPTAPTWGPTQNPPPQPPAGG